MIVLVAESGPLADGGHVEPRISLITLGVRDLERSVRFYRDGLGFPLSSASQEGVAFFQTGGTVLALFARHELAADAQIADDGAGFGGFSLAHNVPSKAEVQATLAQAAAAGAKVVKPAQDVFWGGYNGYFTDPDGFLWEVAYNPFFSLGPDGELQLPK